MNEPSLKDVRPIDPWTELRNYTKARIAIGRAGTGLTTAEVLSFRADHAAARDAVHSRVDFAALESALRQKGQSVLRLRTRARDRTEYLRRPDLGRLLDEESMEALSSAVPEDGGFDVALAIGDGLSAFGVGRYALSVAEAFLESLTKAGRSIAPVALIEQARVGAGDPVGGTLRARIIVILIGERPGLSVSDSLGAYLTYAPKSGVTDEARNCISNIHAAGMSPEKAAAKLVYLTERAFSLGLSGIELKDEEVEIPVLIGME